MIRRHPGIFIGIITLLLILSGRVTAHPAWGIVVDRNNQIYFSDIETIWKIDAEGKLSVFRAGVTGRQTHEINLDESGNLYEWTIPTNQQLNSL